MSKLPFKTFSSSSPESNDAFDDFFNSTHGGTGKASWECEDVDEVEEDDYSENS